MTFGEKLTKTAEFLIPGVEAVRDNKSDPVLEGSFQVMFPLGYKFVQADSDLAWMGSAVIEVARIVGAAVGGLSVADILAVSDRPLRFGILSASLLASSFVEHWGVQGISRVKEKITANNQQRRRIS